MEDYNDSNYNLNLLNDLMKIGDDVEDTNIFEN